MEESESIQSLQEEEQLLLKKLRRIRQKKEKITKLLLEKRPNPQNDQSEIPLKKQRPNRFSTFEKHDGTVNHGDEYQILMCILYALKLSTYDDVIDFEMTANDKKYGLFGDIKLYVTFKNGTVKTFLFQLKHKDNEKMITQNGLFFKQGKGDISIAKCFESLSETNTENTIYILYTNRPTNIQAGISSNDILIEDCLELENKDLIANPQPQNSNSVLQFRSIKTNEKIHFFTKQKNITHTKNIIKDELYHLLQCDIYNSLIQFMNEWWSGNFILNKHDFITKVTELALSPYLKVLSGNKCNEKTENLVKAIMDFELTIIKDNENDVVENIWSNLKTFDKEEYVKTVEKFRLTSVQESNLNTAKILWHMRKVPLVVKVQDSNKESVIAVINFLRKSREDKKIILIGNISRSNCNECNVFENLSDLIQKNPNEVYCQDIVKYFYVSLQGRDPISIDKLLKIDNEFANILETHHLLTMSQLDLVIGRKLKTLPDSYIPRNVIPHCISTKGILEYCGRNVKDSLVIINCDKTFKIQWKHHTNISMIEMTDYLNKGNFQKNEKFLLLSTTTKCTILDFEKVCGKSKKPNVHLLQVLNDEFCILLLNKGQLLQNENENIINIEEDKVHQHFNNQFNAFCAPPGMGKTTLMEVLYNSTPSENWAVYVNLMKINSLLSQKPTHETILNKLLELETEQHSFITQFKNIFLKEKKLHIYLDGLDEVDSSNVNFVISFIKYVSSESVNIWVSSRENLREKLSQDLSAIPIEIQELNEEQQKNYIRKRLKKKFSVGKIDKIINAIFNSSDINNSRELLGIPLQLQIITEMFLTNDSAFKNLEKRNLFVLTQMYKLYFEGKVNSHLKKLGLDEKNSKEQLEEIYENSVEQYEIPALRTCLNEEDYKKLNPDGTKHQNSLRRIKKRGDNYGIIKTIDENCEAIFIHQTYAEYFACSWLKKNLGKVKLLRDRIFSDRYENLRLMFDVMLAENNPLHLAIIYKNMEQFEMNIRHCKEKDFGGRTALCVACMYGEKYTEKPQAYETISRNWHTKYHSKVKRESQFFISIIEALLQQDVDIKNLDHLLDLNCIEYSLKSKCLYPIEKMLETRKINFNEYEEIIFKLYEPQILVSYAAQVGYSNLFVHLGKLGRDQIQSSTKGLLTTAILGTADDAYTSPRTGNITVVNILAQEYYSNVNLYNFYSNSDDNVLDYACRHGCYDVLETLIQNGGTCSDGNTILHSTAKYGTFNEIIIELYVRVNKNQNISDTYPESNGFRSTPKNINHDKRWIKDNTNLFETPNNTLHKINQTKHSNDKANKWFKDIDFNINIRNRLGQTALHLACENGYDEITTTLTEYGADINILDNDKNNTFYYALKAHRPNQKLLSMFIDAGLDVNVQNKYGQTVLHLASEKGYDEIAKKLIEKGIDVNIVDNDNNNALHYASRAYKPNLKLLIMLIDAGLDVNARNKIGQTALHLACEMSYDEIAKKLIKNGADVNILDKDNNNTLHYASTTYRPNEKLLSMLIDAGVDLNVQNKSGRIALHLAYEYGHVEIAKKLIDNGTDVNILDNDNNNTLHYATKAFEPNQELLSVLIEAGLDVNARNKNGQTALHFVCEGYIEFAEKLIENGADVNIPDNDNNNMLHYAMRADKENKDLLIMLIDIGVDVNARNNSGQTPLHLACEKVHNEVAMKLIENGADFKILDKDNNNILHCASRIYRPNQTLLSMLIGYDLDLNARNKSGQTVLHFACENGYDEIAKKLVENGADFKILDNNDNNLLHHCVRSYYTNHKLLSMLIDYGLDVNVRNKSGQTALHLACEKGYVEIAKKLIENGADVNSLDNDNNNTLHYTLKANRPNQILLNMLINGGIDINTRNKDGQTALHFACEAANHEISKKLIKNGASINILDNDNNNILHYTSRAYEENEKLSSMLIDKGLDVNARNKNEQTALHLACEMGYDKIAKNLVENLADVNALDTHNNSMLHYASKCNRANSIILQNLINFGLEINAKNVRNETPLHLACKTDAIENVTELIGIGAETHQITSSNRNLLHCAAASNNIDLFRKILNFGFEVNARDIYGASALHIACKYGSIEVIKELTQHGADIQAINNKNMTALHYATLAEKNQEEVITYLLESGIDAQAKDSNGRNALDYALDKECYSGIKIFVQNNIFWETCNCRNVMFLYYSVYTGYSKGVEMFLNSYENIADIDIYNKEFPLYFALKNGQLDAEIIRRMTEFFNKIIMESKTWDEKYTHQALIHYLQLQNLTYDNIDFIFREAQFLILDNHKRTQWLQRCDKIKGFLREDNEQHHFYFKTLLDSNEDF